MRVRFDCIDFTIILPLSLDRTSLRSLEGFNIFSVINLFEDAKIGSTGFVLQYIQRIYSAINAEIVIFILQERTAR